ncbi:pyridoxal-dependent decarboxylase [Zychaea mexicana]|uniref:pyridoxal-dependent decarboxylase n=1 Tax=Zychaea mexicana TaxID=64656 RepID=UPI0022FEAE1D|nr:pyridoxal-dependent decarboxylase [Zychaea mexicana]KAI9493966.1 pyridoxal-dependent decarboxylase [Zychaea mexicana]
MLIRPSQIPILPKEPTSSVPEYSSNKQPVHVSPIVFKGDIKEAIKKKLELAALNEKLGQDDCFYVLDLGQLYRQHLKWKRCLPRIKPYYAVQCNPDIKIIKYLATLGLDFDCITGPEMKKVMDLGIDASRIYYAHTCKQASYLRFAADHSVKTMTFDNVDELYKIKALSPNAQLLLRIITDDSKAQWGTGNKFGASLSAVESLLKIAKKLALDVIGVSFDVGSGCSDTSSYQVALENSRKVFDQAKNLGFDFHLLDINGDGFLGIDQPGKPSFRQLAANISKTLDSLFTPDVQVMAETGRFYTASTLTVCCQIVGRKMLPTQNENDVYRNYMYFVNDGLHGSFAPRLLYQDVLNLKVLMKDNVCMYRKTVKEPTYPCSVWGHTCEPGDCLTENTRLPLLTAGDWIYAENMGAYTIANSHFCGFQRPKTVYVDTYRNL